MQPERDGSDSHIPTIQIIRTHRVFADGIDSLSGGCATFKRQVVFVASCALALAAKPARAQLSRLPDTIQKKLAEINPLYQSNIRKYGPQTIELFTPLLAAGPKDGVSVAADQLYGADPQQTLDVYQPRGTKDLPVVVFVHGGALTTGDKNENKEVHANVL